MISPGWLPTRPLRMKQRVLAYTRVRRRISTKPRAPVAPRTSDAVGLVFHSGAVEFPVATLRSRDPKIQARVLVGDLRRWLLSMLSWLRPRTVPFVVAALGLVAILASADYLQHVKVTPMHSSPTASR